MWTQIDATQTGLLMPADVESVGFIRDIPALPPGEQGAMPIHAILPDATTAAAIDQTIRVAEQVAIQGRFEQPLVDVSDAALAGAGVNLAVGPHDELAARPGLADLPAPHGPQLELLPATKTRRATILVSGRTPDEVEEAIRRFSEAPSALGSPQGMRAARAFPGYPMESGSRLKLSEVGLISQEFSGRLFRASFNIVMPPDFYPADYGKVQINVAGAYAAGLDAGAQIVLSINNKNIVGSPLGKTTGEVFKARALTFPVGALQPGLNRVTFEAQTPAPQDVACDLRAPGQDLKRFLLLDETELILPAIARVALSPNLSITATGGFPYAALRGASHLFVPKPDPETLGAAMTLVARMALSAGRSMNLRMTSQAPSIADSSTLAIGAASSFTPALLAASGLEPAAMAGVWQNPPRLIDENQKVYKSKYEAINAARIALQRNFPAECRMHAPRAKARPRPSAEAAQASEPGTDDLSGKWEKAVNRGNSWLSRQSVPLTAASHVLDAAGQWLAAARDRLLSPNGARESPISEDASLLLAQKDNGAAGEGIWTIVTGASPTELREGVSCLVDPRVWSQLGGEVAALNSSQAKIVAVAAANPAFITTQPLSYSNLRLIAAGWFSLHVWAFVAFILLMASVLAAVTRWFVSNVGRPA